MEMALTTAVDFEIAVDEPTLLFAWAKFISCDIGEQPELNVRWRSLVLAVGAFVNRADDRMAAFDFAVTEIPDRIALIAADFGRLERLRVARIRLSNLFAETAATLIVPPELHATIPAIMEALSPDRSDRTVAQEKFAAAINSIRRQIPELQRAAEGRSARKKGATERNAKAAGSAKERRQIVVEVARELARNRAMSGMKADVVYLKIASDPRVMVLTKSREEPLGHAPSLSTIKADLKAMGIRVFADLRLKS